MKSTVLTNKLRNYMVKVMGLISSLFNIIALAYDVPFHKPQKLKCIFHGLTQLCPPLCSIYYTMYVLIDSNASWLYDT